MRVIKKNPWKLVAKRGTYEEAKNIATKIHASRQPVLSKFRGSKYWLVYALKKPYRR